MDAKTNGSTHAYIESLLRHGWETFLPELTLEQLAVISKLAAHEVSQRCAALTQESSP